MNVKISGSSKGGQANSGSCAGMVNYLQHEDLEQLQSGKKIELFFNQQRGDIRGQEVIQAIDSNRGQLGKEDAKFYSVIFSPSVKELQYLSESGPAGQPDKLKAYIRREAMAEYAAGFGKGLSADDILYFGKIHYERGRKGQEHQLHVHLIVSRKDKANKKKLSPMTNHRGTSKGAVKGGFNREAFVSGVENRFDKSTGYERDLSESFAYCKSLKSGDLSELLDQVAQRVAREDKSRQEGQKIDPKQQKEEQQKEEQVAMKPQTEVKQAEKESEQPRRGMRR